MIDDDLTQFLGASAAPALKFRQGTVLAFDQATGLNTVAVGGSTLVNLPILSGSESLEYAAGNVVVLLAMGASWLILGRVVTPGGVLAPSAVGSAADWQQVTNFGITTSNVVKVSATLPVPAWANHALVTGTCDFSGYNSRAATDYVISAVVIGGTPGGEMVIQALSATDPGSIGHCHGSVSFANDQAVTPGGTVVVSGRLRTNGGTWTANVANACSITAAATFRRS